LTQLCGQGGLWLQHHAPPSTAIDISVQRISRETVKGSDLDEIARLSVLEHMPTDHVMELQ
jgi:hypothetical protein